MLSRCAVYGACPAKTVTVLLRPPLTEENRSLAVLLHPPLTVDATPSMVLSLPTTNPPTDV